MRRSSKGAWGSGARPEELWCAQPEELWCARPAGEDEVDLHVHWRGGGRTGGMVLGAAAYGRVLAAAWGRADGAEHAAARRRLMGGRVLPGGLGLLVGEVGRREQDTGEARRRRAIARGVGEKREHEGDGNRGWGR